MAPPVSLPKVLHDVNLVKKEVESNKQILLTILSTLKTFKDDSQQLNAALSSKIKDVDNKVSSIRTAVSEITGPSADLGVDDCVNESFEEAKDYVYDINEVTTNRGVMKCQNFLKILENFC